MTLTILCHAVPGVKICVDRCQLTRQHSFITSLARAVVKARKRSISTRISPKIENDIMMLPCVKALAEIVDQ